MLAAFNLGAGVADGAAGSLREAIAVANANAEDDTIQLGAGTYNLTLGGSGEDANATGDLDLTETAHTVTIVGAGATDTIIDASLLGDRILHVLPGVTLILTGVTLTGGNVPGDLGGALSSSGTATIDHCTFSNNRAEGFGGAIFNDSGATMSLADSLISQNTSVFRGAGGIDNLGTLTLLRTTISDNHCKGEGGAVNNRGVIEFVSCDLIDNVSGGNGGALLNFKGTMTLSDTTVSHNRCDGSNGGGISSFSGTIGISGSVISDNTSEHGGAGITLAGDDALTMTDSVVSGNNVKINGAGGGISMNPGSSATITRCTISGNFAEGSDGGGLYANSATVTLADSTISSNWARWNGGGLALGGTSLVTVVNCTISGNYSAEIGGGGGVFNGAIIHVTNCTIWGNDNGAGGGILNGESGTAEVRNTIISGNFGHAMPDVLGEITSLGHNLIGNSNGGSGYVASDLLNMDPLVGPLQDNEGPTLTHALPVGSPAIDAGDDSVFPGVTGPTDQRGPGFARVSDGDGNGTATIDIGALEFASPNQPPTADAGGPYTVPEGGIVQLDASATTDPNQDTTTLVFAWDLDGDGVFGETGVWADRGDEVGITPTFSAGGLDGPSSWLVTLHVTDDGGLTSVDSATIGVTNAAPLVAIAGATDGVRGQARTFILSASDASAGDDAAGFAYLIDWGDGSPTQTVAPSPGNGAGVSIDHVFTAHGTDTVRVTATDRDGALSAWATRVVTVTVAAIQPDWLDPTRNVLVVGGSTIDDDIKLKPGEDPGDIKVKIHDEDRFKYKANFDPPIARIVVYGQAGDDDITVTNTITIPAWLYGQDGDDRLRGGGGPSVLLGGAGDDLLVGAAGRDILIGGTGSDKVVGDKGDDVLIAGYTAYDANDAALTAVLAEWTSDRSYSDRVRNLRGDTSAPTFASRANVNIFLNVYGSYGRAVTVFDDGECDVLTGNAGLDWFLFNADGDNQATKDKITDLHAAELADDIDFITGT